jgi:predicted metal-dependent HD superfamily phosphohydrolase
VEPYFLQIIFFLCLDEQFTTSLSIEISTIKKYPKIITYIMLQQTFKKLLLHYTTDHVMIENLWMEIIENYEDNNRYYHTLSHLENILQQLLDVKSKINNWETILFTLFYHDIIYNASSHDNEEQSSLLAQKRMQQINVPNMIIENAVLQILATKKHQFDGDSDTNYFTDADLTILGMEAQDYKKYYKNIRKEYAIYDNEIYNEGRKKVLQHFLNMKRIYKTEYFYSKYEQQANLNIKMELYEINYL